MLYLLLILALSQHVDAQDIFKRNQELKAQMLGYYQISMIQLIVNPGKYQDKNVRVIGYFCCGPGSVKLYLTKEHSDYADWTNSVSLDFADGCTVEGKRVTLAQRWKLINGKFIDVTGTFDQNYKDMAGSCPGSITGIKNVEICFQWYDGKKWRGPK